MVQELAAQTAESSWAIASLVFFLVWFAAVTSWVLTRKKGYFDVQAALPLEGRAPARDPAGHPCQREN
jgi:hypothetical protein